MFCHMRQCPAVLVVCIGVSVLYISGCFTVAQWLLFWAVNHDNMGSNPAETVLFIFVFHV